MNLEQKGRSKMHLIINAECESYDVRIIAFEFAIAVREDFLVTVKMNNNMFFSNNIKQKYV